MEEVPALGRLDITLGEHLATIEHRGKNGQAVLTLGGTSLPRGDVDGWDLPDDAVTRDASGAVVGAGFPSYESASDLRGWMRSGPPIALLDVHLTFVLMDRAHLVCNTALIGFGIDDAQDLKFERLRLQVTGLGEVMGFGMIGAAVAPFLAQRPLTEVTVNVNPDAKVQWSENGVNCEARIDPTFSGYGDPYHYEISSTPCIEITTPEPHPWAWWHEEWVRPIQHLVSLATRTPSHLASVELQTRKQHDFDPDIEHWPTVQVFGHGIQWTPYRIQQRPDQPPLFALASSPLSLQAVVENWRTLQRDHPGFVDTYLPVLHEAPMPQTARFLFQASAVEALHSSLHGETPIPLDAYRVEQARLVAKIADSNALTPEEVTALGGHLAPTNFFSLPHRISALRKALPGELVQAAKLRSLASEVPTVRNKIAHGRELTRDDLKQVRAANRGLGDLIDAHLLLLLGLPLDGLMARIEARD